MSDTPLHRETYPELADRRVWLEALRTRRTAIVERVKHTRQSIAQVKLLPTTAEKVAKRLARIDKTLQDIEDKLNKAECALSEALT